VSSTNETHPDPITAAVDVVEGVSEQAERLAPRRRRLLRALMELDLLDDVGGRDWVQIGEDGFEFRPLTSRQSDLLTRALEDLVTKYGGQGIFASTSTPNAEGQGVLPLGWGY